MPSVNEGFHDFVLVNRLVGRLRGVDEEVGLVVGGEGDIDAAVLVAYIYLRESQFRLVWNGLVVLDCAPLGARWGSK